MTLTRPIPKEALPVVRRLRLEVERPAELPEFVIIGSELPSLRWDERCPMGLHPDASEPTPVSSLYLPGSDDDAINAFYHWWDDQTDPQAATDAIWPPDGRWCRQCGSRPVDPAKGTVPLLFPCVDCDREVCGDCGEVEGDPDAEA